MMNDTQQRHQAALFAEKWAGRGYEKGETQTFWLSLLRDVLGEEHPDELISFEQQVLLSHTSFIDGYIKRTHVLIEQKSLGKDLRAPIRQSDGTMLTPFEQAKRYSSEMAYSERPRWLVTCNFETFLIYDMENPKNEPQEIRLDELEREIHRLRFLVDDGMTDIRKEMEVSIAAGAMVGKMYDALLDQYHGTATAQDLHSLNVLCVRLVFCMYAEDASIFPIRDQFYNYLNAFQPENMRVALRELFAVLDTPIAERSRFLEPKLAEFPYVAGSIFKQQPGEDIPPITPELANLLLDKASKNFDWSEMSPTIFGAVFESTLNPETRRSGGMHYTSIENIHRVIDPLFLDDLKAEMAAIKLLPTGKEKKNRLEHLHAHIAELDFLDPACGSGNFLTETYISLRRLENEIIIEELGGQSVMGIFEDPIRVKIDHFHGIEINDFAISVAMTALWIAESQMMKKTQVIVQHDLDFLPLTSYTNLVEGNALRIDWETLCPKERLNYIIGNPPFVGQAMRTKEQADDMQHVFAPSKNGGKLDYVCGWYKKAADLITGTDIEVAFVSSNSICQGESVNLLWELLLNDGIHINFAYDSFKWVSESSQMAAVICVIVSFSYVDRKDKFIYVDGERKKSNHINGYLKDAPDVFIKNRSKSINVNLAKVVQGSPPADNGRLLLNKEEKNTFINKYPILENVIKPFIGSREFINEIEYVRFCFWFVGEDMSKYRNIPELIERFNYIQDYRLSSPVDRIQKTANKPFLFTQNRQPTTDYLIIPRVSSERRKYIPIGFLPKDVIASDSAVLVYNAKIMDFGIISSRVHMAWVRTIAGRLKNDYRYAPSVYYNFPFPQLSQEQELLIEKTAQAIIDARDIYKDVSLADMYGEAMYLYPELLEAHQANDRAVLQAYGLPTKDITESQIVAELFKRYAALTAKS